MTSGAACWALDMLVRPYKRDRATSKQLIYVIVRYT